jgi:hypothetical protein
MASARPDRREIRFDIRRLMIRRLNRGARMGRRDGLANGVGSDTIRDGSRSHQCQPRKIIAPTCSTSTTARIIATWCDHTNSKRGLVQDVPTAAPVSIHQDRNPQPEIVCQLFRQSPEVISLRLVSGSKDRVRFACRQRAKLDGLFQVFGKLLHGFGPKAHR